MNLRTANILSIGINRQRIGIAVFTNGRLEYVIGKAVPAAASLSGRKQLVAGIKDLVRRHNIAILALPKLTAQQVDSRGVTRINKRIQVWAIRNGLTLYVESGLQRIDPDELALIYPELRRYLGATSWERRYYKHIFKAVAAGGAWMSLNEKEGTTHDQ